MTGSVLFYVQHLLGIGHMRRALRLVDALASTGLEVTLVSGGEPLPASSPTTAKRIVELAPIRARDASFKVLVDAAGRPVNDRLRAERRAALLDAFAAARPDALVIEAFPFGRRALRFELEPLLDAARSRRPRPLVLCSIRDIVIVPEDADRRREIIDRVRADFDIVLVHGDPAFIALEASFPPAPEIADRLVYTGYVAEPVRQEEADDTAGANEVLVSVGGGAVGAALLAAAIESRRQGCLTGNLWRLLAGPNLPEREFIELSSRLPSGVILERYRPEFPNMLRRCRVSVSQAGYNTVVDILAARAAAVLVPFSSERETEQGLRAERLAVRGVVELVAEAELTPARLAEAIERASTRGAGTISLDTGGARRTAALIAKLIGDAGSVGGKFLLRPTSGIISL